MEAPSDKDDIYLKCVTPPFCRVSQSVKDLEHIPPKRRDHYTRESFFSGVVSVSVCLP